MNTRNRFWLVVIGSIVGLVVIACSCSNLIPKSTQAPNGGGNTGGEAVPGLAGQWLDPDTTGTYHVIVWQSGQYVVTTTMNPNRGGNEVTKSSWSNGVLTWTYCVPDGACVTTTTISVSGDNLETSWTSDNGNSGNTTLTRMH